MRKPGITMALLITWISATGLIYIYLLLSKSRSMCLLSDICFSNKDSPLLMAIGAATTLVIIMLTWKLTEALVARALARGYIISLGAWVLIGVGIFGVTVLFLVTPSHRIVDFIHIIVIGCLSVCFGVFMLYSTYKNLKNSRKRRKQ